jgi:ribonuclease HII
MEETISKPKRRKQVPTLEIEEMYWSQGLECIAGVDEAGRGPLAGPVVAGAVILPKGLFIDGVNDSKKLRAINIYQASILAMRKAVENLPLLPAIVLADGNSFKHETLRYRNVIGGDATSLTIAAGSIIAKVTRDSLMREYHEQFPLYGFDRHKGYGTKLHIDALRQHGMCPIHRRSFHMSLEISHEVSPVP